MTVYAHCKTCNGIIDDEEELEKQLCINCIAEKEVADYKKEIRKLKRILKQVHNHCHKSGSYLPISIVFRIGKILGIK
jgi:reverse gyrase